MNQIIKLVINERDAVVIVAALHSLVREDALGDDDIKRARALWGSLTISLRETDAGINACLDSAIKTLRKAGIGRRTTEDDL